MEFDIWHLEIKQFLELECDIGSETYKQIPSIIATDIWKLFMMDPNLDLNLWNLRCISYSFLISYDTLFIFE